MKTHKPKITTTPAPLKPLLNVSPEQSVLLGRSRFMATGHGLGDAAPPYYEPVEDGGFSISGSTRKLNRPIVHGQNRLWTGDVPLFTTDTVTGNGCYIQDRCFPLWARPDASIGDVNPAMGSLRLGTVNDHVPLPLREGLGGRPLGRGRFSEAPPAKDEEPIGAPAFVPRADPHVILPWVPDDLPAPTAEPIHWFHDRADIKTTFRPGYTQYEFGSEEPGDPEVKVTIAPALDFHGLICRIEFSEPTILHWQFGGIWWKPSEANANTVRIEGNRAEITEANLPNGLVSVGSDVPGTFTVLPSSIGEQVHFASAEPRLVHHVVATWGVTEYDQARAEMTKARLDTAAAQPWPERRDELKEIWFQAYIARAQNPRENLQSLLDAPEAALRKNCDWWDARRAEFQIATPDPYLNALINWTRSVSEYHRQGPGLVLGGQIWQMYSHLSTGWYGKSWGGDHAAIEQMLRYYASKVDENGFIGWMTPSLMPLSAEDNNPYWIDQVWQHYRWTGDKQFAADMWPIVRNGVDRKLIDHDTDNDGLFSSHYEYWNCDSNGKGPKAAAATAAAYAMLRAAAGLADAVGEEAASQRYDALADKTRAATLRELWNEKAGRLGSIGADEIWRGHGQTWEQYLAINYNLLETEKGLGAMRWLLSHYGFEPEPGVHLLMNSDWFPIRWSTQWVPTGDTCLAAMAAMKCGDTDHWWPTIQTVLHSAFHSEFPGISMSISNHGAGGGDREDVDSDDPYVQMTARGLFGIEPNLHRGSIDICPSFPSSWTEASIQTPDISYHYQRENDKATFTITSALPLEKCVRANPGGSVVVTPAESISRVEVHLGPAVLPAPSPTHPPTILHEQQPPAPPKPLTEAQISRQVHFDLSGHTNQTSDELINTTLFIFDHEPMERPITDWWHNPPLRLTPFPQVVESPLGVSFLTSGRPESSESEPPKNLLALASWKPYPLPAAVNIEIGLRCERLFLLLQNYVHPIKNYIPNGEVVLRYADGTEAITSLVPPFNLDCYFQVFSREGAVVPMGEIEFITEGWSPIPVEMAQAHATALEIECDGGRELVSIEVRATCSEGVIGLMGITAVGV